MNALERWINELKEWMNERKDGWANGCQWIHNQTNG